jgi:hypothetical protein
MHAVSTYPTYAVGNCCFLTGDGEVPAGEQVLDLDVEVEMLADGRLCVSTTAVRRMAHELGLTISGDELELANQRLTDLVVELRAENMRMRQAMTKVLQANKLAGLTEWATT